MNVGKWSVSGRVMVGLFLVAGVLLAQQLVLIEGWNGSVPVKVKVDSSGQLLTVAGPVCSSSAAVTLSASGNTQILAFTSSKQIQICHFSYSGSTTADMKLVYGTGSNCATGLTSLTGVYGSVQSIALDLAGSLILPASKSLCVNLSAANAYGGLLTYNLK